MFHSPESALVGSIKSPRGVSIFSESMPMSIQEEKTQLFDNEVSKFQDNRLYCYPDRTSFRIISERRRKLKRRSFGSIDLLSRDKDGVKPSLHFPSSGV